MLKSLSLVQKVVVVQGSPEGLDALETILEPGLYEIIAVASSEDAYSQIKYLQPHLVVLYMGLDDVRGFHVLSMLNLDDETRRIPVVTYTTEYEGQALAEDVVDTSGWEPFVPKAAVWMN